MKRDIITYAMLTCALLANAEVRTSQQALDIAKQFMSNNATLFDKNSSIICECKEATAKARKVYGMAEDKNLANPYYIFNIEKGGYVIVSGDDRFESILGYSDEGCISATEELPDGLAYWLGMYEKEMVNATETSKQTNPRMAAKATDVNYFRSVEPMLKTKWDQGVPYNNMTPSKYPTGCVATGTAQVMKYWSYPETGIGSHTNKYNGSAFANFETTTYDWNNMLNEYGWGFETAAQVNAVATIMYHLGVATDMRWTAKQSGTENVNAGSALVNNFGYNKYIYSEQRDCMSAGAWKALVIEQLQSGHPLCYAGADVKDGQYAGHFFVCDGYDANTGKFHFNWGWSGRANGYYALSALTPSELGTGAGFGSYNYDQHILVNVQPSETGSYRSPFDAKTVAPINATCNKSSLVMRTNQLSNSAVNFNGVFGAAVYDDHGSLVKFAPAKEGFPVGLNPGSSFNNDYDMTFDLSDVPNGTYTMCIASQCKDYKDILTPIRAFYENPYTYKMTVSGNNLTLEAQDTNPEVSADAAPTLVSNSDGLVYQNIESHYTITVTNNSLTDFFDEVGVRLGNTRGGGYVDFLTPCHIPAGQTKTVDIYGVTPSIFNIGSSQKIYNIVSYNGKVLTIGSNASVTVKSEADDIPFVNADDESDNTIYSINGQVMSSGVNLPKGIYIQNNKKFIVK